MGDSYLGVVRDGVGGGWCAKTLDTHGRPKLVGSFYLSPEDAARAYDCAALAIWGKGTTTNFPVAGYSRLQVRAAGEKLAVALHADWHRKRQLLQQQQPSSSGVAQPELEQQPLSAGGQRRGKRIKAEMVEEEVEQGPGRPRQQPSPPLWPQQPPLLAPGQRRRLPCGMPEVPQGDALVGHCIEVYWVLEGRPFTARVDECSGRLHHGERCRVGARGTGGRLQQWHYNTFGGGRRPQG